MNDAHGFHHSDDEPRLLPLRGGGEPTQLRRLIDDLVAEAAAERQARALPSVPVEIDVAEGHATAIGTETLRAALLPLLRAACQSAALARGAASARRRFSEVVVTSVDTGTAIEIEVADSATESADDFPAMALALNKARAFADRCGGQVALTACPEGGLAVTLRLPHRRARGLAA